MNGHKVENIATVISYIEAHLNEKLDLDTVANAVCYSKYHLHRMFTDNRAFRVPKSVEELIFDVEQRELLNKAIAALPEIQRRRFLLYHEYDLNYRQIGEMEHCRPQSIRHSVIQAREKIKAVIEKYQAGQ